MKRRLPADEMGVGGAGGGAVETPVCLTVAGSDCSGGAGIQADLKTFAMLRCYGASALTALTVQNTLGVTSVHQLGAGFVREQVDAVAADLPVAATKTGMLGSAEVIKSTADCIERHELYPYVLDPVMRAKSGDPLIDAGAEQAMVERLVRLASVVTPNRHEAARLTGMSASIETATSAATAAEQICVKLGAKACVVKAVHRRRHGRDECVDVLFDGHEIHEVVSPWYAGTGTHGSGCTFSAALTAMLAQGRPLLHALDVAKRFVHVAIHHELQLGMGAGPVNHIAWWDV